MSVLPAFVNAIFTLNKKGEYLLYEGEIDNGYTKVSIVTNVAQGYNVRYYKVKQIIAFNDSPAIKQSFDLPSQEFAYRLVEKAIMEQVMAGENNESKSIPVVVTGQQSRNNYSDSTRAAENQNYSENTNNSAGTYKSVVASQSRKSNEGLQSGIISEEEVFGNTSFNDLSFATGTGSGFDQEFSGGVKIANMSSFADGSNSNRNGNKASGYESLESALDSGF